MDNFDFYNRKIRELAHKSLHMRYKVKTINAKLRLFWFYRYEAYKFYKRYKRTNTEAFSDVFIPTNCFFDFISEYPAFSLFGKNFGYHAR